MENLGAPVRKVALGSTMAVPNPGGKSWDIVQVYFAQYGGPNEIVAIDGDTGAIQQVKVPREPYVMQWTMAPSLIAPNGKLFIYTGGATPFLHIYNPAENSLGVCAVRLPPAFNSPGHGHPMSLGADGKIYCAAGYGKDRFGACQVDPDTLKVVDYGPMGDPKHGANLPWYIATDQRYLYVVGAKLPWSLAIYDRQTGKTETLLASPGIAEMILTETPFGCLLSAKGKEGDTFWLDGGKAIPSKGTASRMGGRRQKMDG